MNKMASYQGYGGALSYHFAETVTAATGDALLMPGLERNATVAVFPGTGATVQVTASHPNDIKAGTAKWIDWTQGQITAPTMVMLPERVTAARLVANADASDWEVLV
ncbi:hypothetical protein [Chromohalobacter sp. HP20-39]|uniref:hypothetical protein n=1 Tax=Chromohalobacter sp. HP20-39 TaxID=3079306 RepID=UPI00294B5398|nr:hypothetical protein [Chromohalobacter sp. HP20-39]MDV6318798.1 hypothetical protein [Chromohalobacter sp. HP20-39]